MQWPPKIPIGALDSVARRALAFQRTHFLKSLKLENALVPHGTAEVALQHGTAAKVPETTVSTLKSAIESTADELAGRYAEDLPSSCNRAPGHLQIVTLAIAAQRCILDEARTNSAMYLTTSGMRVRSVVADALGVVAPPDGTPPKAVPVQYVPNMIALGLCGALWSESRRRSMATRMVDNFARDLGECFLLEPLDDHPAPSMALRYCFYSALLREEGEHDLLAPVFTALHEPTFSGVPEFEFEVSDQTSGECKFIFR